MAVSDIMLRVGTELGPGGFASLESAINMVVQLTGAIADQIKRLDEFSEAYSRTTIRVGEVVEATAGLVDSMSIMASANKVAQAELKITTEQMSAIAKVATEYADATGGSAAAETEKLTEALIRGSARGLKPYGIDLKDGQSQADAFAEALGKITERAKEVEIEADTLTDAWEAMTNSIKSTTGILWSESGNDDDITASERPLTWGFNQLARLINEVGVAAEKTGSKMMTFAGTAAVLRGVFGDMSAIQSIVDQKEMDDYIKAGGLAEEWGQSEMAPDVDQSVMSEKASSENLAMIEAKARGSMSRRSGGGGSRRKEPATMDEMIFTEEEAAAGEEAWLMEGYAAKGRENRRGSAFFGSGWEEDSKLLEQQEAYLEQLERENELTMERQEIQVSFAEAFADAWNTAYSGVTAGAMVFTGVMDTLHASIAASFNTLITGTGSVKKAIWAAVRDVGLAVGIEATFQAIFETAKAIAAAVSSWGMSPEVEGHAIAAAAYAATAVAAFGAAAIASNKVGSAGSSGHAATASASSGKGAGSYGASYGGGMYANGGTNSGGDTKVVVVLKGDAGKLFDTVSGEQDKRRANGYREARAAA